MVDIKTAVINAKAFAQDFVEDSLINLSLEEIDLSDNDSYWMITLGWDDPAVNMPSIGGFDTGLPKKRKYKTFFVNKETGDVEKMKRG